MKTFLLCIAVLVAGVWQAQAQRFYIRAGAGYGFPHAGQVSGMSTGTANALSFINGRLNTGGANPTGFEIGRSSFAAGLQLKVGGGYMFSKHLGVDLEAGIGIAPKEHTLIIDNSATGVTYTATYMQKAKLPLILTPAVVIQTGAEKINIYGRFGAALPISAKVEEQYTNVYTAAGAGREVSIVSEQSPKFSIGLAAAAGAKLMIAKRLYAWIEASLLSMSLYAGTSEIKEYLQDGADRTAELPREQKFVTYGFSGNGTDNTVATYSMPFSNIAVNTGISFDF